MLGWLVAVKKRPVFSFALIDFACIFVDLEKRSTFNSDLVFGA